MSGQTSMPCLAAFQISTRLFWVAGSFSGVAATGLGATRTHTLPCATLVSKVRCWRLHRRDRHPHLAVLHLDGIAALGRLFHLVQTGAGLAIKLPAVQGAR